MSFGLLARGTTLIALFSGLSIAAETANDVICFRGDSQRTGWFSGEPHLSTEAVAGPSFGLLWTSEELESSGGKAAHCYGAPLYLDQLAVSAPPVTGTFHVTFAATSSGDVYAINALATPQQKAGTILWRRHLGKPATSTDGGVPVGVLGTPTIDRTTNRLYVCADTDDAASGKGWKIFALNLGDGSIQPGWPVVLSNEAVSAPGINANGPSAMGAQQLTSQRGALTLSPDGSLVYLVFGAYGDAVPGWLVAVNTTTAHVVAAFSGGRSAKGNNGGMWSSAGVTLDAHGNVFAVTGNGPPGQKDHPGAWGQSVLTWPQPGKDGFMLTGTYTPFNYEAADNVDIDLGSSAAIIIPDLDPQSTSTPHLAVVGGKQGNVYLLDRSHLPGSLEHRPLPSTDSSTDGSLLPTEPQPQFKARGPVNVFGPYTDLFGNWDNARSRSTPAYFRGPDGSHYVIATGTTKTSIAARDNAAPCLARLRIVTGSGKPAYLAVDGVETTQTLNNPGCAVISSDGVRSPIVWVLDAPMRSASLVNPATVRPVLYAFDALSLKLLWKSGEHDLGQGGKYSAPTIAKGMVLVATDRVYAFGIDPTRTTHN
jgi:hypothetical protein